MSSKQDNAPAVEQAVELHDISELLAHALALEEEAAERYEELADVMESHNNPQAAGLFSKMADIEQLHVEEIRRQIARHGLKDLPSTKYRWVGLEGPETTDHADLHYLMTPHQALSLALINERRARDYYRDIANRSCHEEVVKLAVELAHEEREHVAWVEQWLERFPPAEEDWDFDYDPPNLQG